MADMAATRDIDVSGLPSFAFGNRTHPVVGDASA